MSPVTHLLVSWIVANSDHLDRRDRMLVTVSGIVPDVDGLGLIGEWLTRDSPHPVTWWSDYHHVLAHNIGFCIFCSLIVFAFARKRPTTVLLAFVAFHLRLLGDLLGAKGPDGEQWPIPYLLPFSDAWQWTWSGQWALNAWPNFLITVVAIGMALWIAVKRGRSRVEILSPRLDGVVVRILRQRFLRASRDSHRGLRS